MKWIIAAAIVFYVYYRFGRTVVNRRSGATLSTQPATSGSVTVNSWIGKAALPGDPQAATRRNGPILGDHWVQKSSGSFSSSTVNDSVPPAINTVQPAAVVTGTTVGYFRPPLVVRS